MSLATDVIFRSHRLNFAEHLVLNVYLFSMQTLAFIPMIPFLALGNNRVAWVVLIPVPYTVWFYANVFELG